MASLASRKLTKGPYRQPPREIDHFSARLFLWRPSRRMRVLQLRPRWLTRLGNKLARIGDYQRRYAKLWEKIMIRPKSLVWIVGLFVSAALFVAGRAHADPIKLQPIAVTASSTYQGSSPSYATDGNSATQWNAGVAPNHQPYPWIQLDLGRTVAIQKIRLQIAQSPSGTTGHLIDVGQDSINLANLTSKTVNSSDGQWIEYTCQSNQRYANVRYVRITVPILYGSAGI